MNHSCAQHLQDFNPPVTLLIHCNGASMNIFSHENFPSYEVYSVYCTYIEIEIEIEIVIELYGLLIVKCILYLYGLLIVECILIWLTYS